MTENTAAESMPEPMHSDTPIVGKREQPSKADQKQDTPVTGRYLLTGGTGLVGQALARALLARGGTVLQAVRSGQGKSGDGAASQVLEWDASASTPFASTEPLEGLHAAIHLSGANLAAKRWTPAYKREIVASRTVTTGAIARTLASLERPPKILLVASATGIYGDRGEEVLTDDSSDGKGFLTDTCEAWEAAAAPATQAGIRVVHMRFGVVLTPKGGALAKMLPLFKLGLGGKLGDGRQWMSWITLEDLVRGALHIADGAEVAGRELSGAVNFVAPAPVTNAEYTRALGAALHRPAFATAPAFALRLALGEMADEALLASCRAVPEKLLASGFRFQAPNIEAALRGLLPGDR